MMAFLVFYDTSNILETYLSCPLLIDSIQQVKYHACFVGSLETSRLNVEGMKKTLEKSADLFAVNQNSLIEGSCMI